MISCSDTKEITVQSKPLLHTFVEIKVCGKNAEKVINQAFVEMERVNSLLNNYDRKSEVSKINKFSGEKAVGISLVTMEALQQAVMFANMSNGAFDFTIGPLLKLWGFSKEKAGLDSDNPTPEKINMVKEFVDYRALKLKVLKNGNKKASGNRSLRSILTVETGPGYSPR